MDEDLATIVKETRKEKIKNFYLKNKKQILTGVSIFLLIIFSIFIYLENAKNKKIKIANKFVSISASYDEKNKEYFEKEFIEIIQTYDPTYGPLALYFIIDNKIIDSKEEINNLFDEVINNSDLDKEVKNLMIYKKGLFNAEFQTENKMIEILKPIINSESYWKPHSLLLLGDFFMSKGEKNKWEMIVVGYKFREREQCVLIMSAVCQQRFKILFVFLP